MVFAQWTTTDRRATRYLRESQGTRRGRHIRARAQHDRHARPRHTALEMMRVVVPDASFGSWLIRANVMNGELSAMLDWTTLDKTKTARPTQEDRVVVTLKKNLGERAFEL